jgi:hypothetical protein
MIATSISPKEVSKQKGGIPIKQPPDFELMAIPIFRAAFLMTENHMTKEARSLVNSCPRSIYDMAFMISEGNRKDKGAILLRYVFRAIEIKPDMNWFKDMKRMRERLVNTDWEEFVRLYNIYRRKPYNKCPCKPLPLFPC